MRSKGLLCGLISSSSFGLIPFFALPLMAQGMSFDSILFYRFVFGGMLLGGLLLVRKEGLWHTDARTLLTLALLSALYTGAALFVFLGLYYLPGGIVTTIHFLYPVFVALLMLLFGEPKSVMTFAAIALACMGVGLLSHGGDVHGVSWLGIGIVLLSAICNALYIVGMYRWRLAGLSGIKITFFLLWFGAGYILLFSGFREGIQGLDSLHQLGEVVLLALFTAAISNVTLVIAVKHIGSTLASILGALEPVTAVTVGVLIFHEPLTSYLFCGIALILIAVTLIILARPLEQRLSQLGQRLRRRS